MRELRVLLKDTETGKQGWYSDQFPDDYPSDAVDYMWTEGNNACDCNRGDYLAEALDEPRPNLPCAGSRIVVLEATLDGQPFGPIVDHEAWRAAASGTSQLKRLSE